VENLENFVNMFNDISFLEDKISLCVTHVPEELDIEDVKGSVMEVTRNEQLKDKTR